MKKIKINALYFITVFTLVFFLNSSYTAEAAIAQVQKAQGSTAGSATTVSATWGSATTAGNLLVAVIGLKNSGTITPPVVSGNAWTLAVRNTSAADANSQVASNAIYYIKNANSQSGASTWTFTSSRATLHIVEYSGVDTVSPLDVTASNVGTTSPTSSGTTATTSQANEIAISGVNDSRGAGSAGAAFTITSSGWTEEAEVGSTTGNQNLRTDGAFDQKILSATGTQVATNTYNSGTSLNYASTIATFKQAAPSVTNVTSSLANGAYANNSGQVVPIQVTFSESVTVTGTPQLTLATGSPANTAVNYTSGSPGTTLTFNYTVANNNYSSDLDYSDSGSLTLNGGTITATSGGANAILTLASPGAAGSLGANKAIVITHPVPTITSIDPTSIGRSPGGMISLFTDMTVNGTNFDNASKIYFNGGEIGTSFNSSIELFSSGNVPIGTSGIFPITVFNTTPGGGTSNSTNFTVTPFAPGTPDMTAGTDLGSSSTDNITSDTTPNFTISCETGSTVTLYDNVTSVGTGTCAAETVTITSSALSEGTHASMNAKQTDSQGNVSNTSTASSNLSITIDVTEPIYTEVTPVPTYTNDNTPNYTFNSNEAGTITYGGSCSSATTTMTSGNNTITFNTLSDGSYSNCTISITDTAGNSVLAPFLLDPFTVDTSTPAAPGTPNMDAASDSGVSSTDNNTNDNTPTFTISCETGATVTLLRDGSSVGSGTCVASSVSITASTLPDNVILVSMTATQTDAANNESAASSGLSITIDTTAPTPTPTTPNLLTSSDTGSSTTDNITNDTTPSFAISCGANTSDGMEILSGITVLGTNYDTSGCFLSEGEGALSIGVTSSVLSDNTYSITAKRIDTAGNESAASSGLSVTIDTASPSAPTSLATSPSSPANSTTPSVKGSAEADSTVKIYTNNTCSSSIAGTGTATGGSFSIGVTVSANSTTDFYATATDVAGNVSSCSTSTVQYINDSTAPTLTTRSIASDNTTPSLAKTGDTVTLSFTSSETIQTPTTAFYSGGNPVGGLVNTSNPSGNNWEASYTTDSGDTEGAVTFTIDFQDLVGNNGTQVTTTTNASSVTFDKTAPVLAEVTPVPTPTTDDTPDYTFSSTEAGTITYGGDCDSATTSAVVGNNTVTFNTLSNGAHTNCTITVTDATGNDSTELDVSNFTVNTALDHFSIDTIASPQTAGTPFNIVITAKNSDNATLTSFTGTVNISTTAGSISPTVSGSFVAGTRTESVTVTQSGTAKTITVTKPITLETGTSNTFDVNPGALDHFNINTISSPQAEAVAFDITMTAKDANNNTVTGFTDTVDLTTNSGSISPTVSSAFVGGVRTESVTLTGSGAGRTITATRTSGSETGTSNSFTVTPAPTKFVIIDPTDDTVGNNVTVTVEARDAFDDVVTSYQYDVTLEVDGDATIVGGNPLIDIVNGIGTIQVTDETAETVNLTLSDTESTGLNVDSTQDVIFAPGAVHHFTFDTVASPQTAGTPFDIAITARDTFDNTDTSFTGTVNITSTGTLSAGSGTTASFTAGVLAAHSVTISNTGSFTITATKTGDTETGTSNSFTVQSDATSEYLLNDPGDMTVGTRVAYTVTRKDQFANLGTVGTETVYLYSTNPGATDLFYDAAVDGNEITEIDITDGSSSANFWYYDDVAGDWTITASDNSSAPDGGTGINDSTDDISVDIAPIVATKFIIIDPTDGTVGDIINVTIKAVDNANSVDTTYMNDVSIQSSGSATPSGAIVVDIVNGIGSINITDLVAETVDLTLTDSQSTLLDVTSTQNLVFAPGPLDYFEIAPFASTQTAGETFDIDISAFDQYGNIATSFIGTVDLEIDAGSISPTISGSFTAGVRTQTVYATLAGTGNLITVTRTGGSETGASALFDVVPGSLDNFLVEAAGGGNISTQTAGVPFDIRLTARDAFNNTLDVGPNAYNDSAIITSTGTLSAGDGSTASFANGVLTTHSVTISDTGLFTITAEDGAASGTSNNFTVSSAPIVATKFIILDPTDATAGETVSVTVKAVDNSNNVDSTYQTDVTLSVTGSATGAGLVNIINGVGTIDITDATVELILLSLSDTELTGLNISSTQNLNFGAVTSSSAGGHKAAATQSISSTGRTIPSGRVTLFALAGTGVPLKQELSSSDGSYSLRAGSILPGIQFYGLLVTDKNGLLSQAKIYQIDSTDPSLSLENFISSPTIGLLRSTLTKGDFLTITGYANVEATIQFEIDGQVIDEKVRTNEDGSYKLLYGTAGLELGEHSVRTRQILDKGGQSEFSISKTFKVSDLIVTASDFNNDGNVDVRDASVFLSNWLKPESEQAKEKIDFNKDGKVDLQDFSIFVKSLKL